MKTLQQFLATMLLVLAFSIPVYAGDVSVPVGGPPPPPQPPPDQVWVIITDPTDSTPVDIDMPTWEILALDLLWSALPMY